MAQKFTKFVIRLGEDPKLRAKYKKNPRATMKKAGLTNAEMSIMLSRKKKYIQAAVIADIGRKAADEIIMWVTIVK